MTEARINPVELGMAKVRTNIEIEDEYVQAILGPDLAGMVTYDDRLTIAGNDAGFGCWRRRTD